MTPAECTRLETYLRRLLHAPALHVKAGKGGDADLLVGEAKVADIGKDEDEGELSYYVNLPVARAKGAPRNAPLDAAERDRIEKDLQHQLGALGLTVRARPRKTDSAEVYVGEEFIGTLSVDDASAEIGYFLTMSILDIDLEDQ